MAQHRTQVLDTGNTWAAACSCGWTGADRSNSGAARVDANKHRIDAQREAADRKPVLKK